MSWLGLEGRRAVIAGGAGGFGSAIAAALREQGAAVEVIDVVPGDHVVADLREPDAARAAMAVAADRLGGLDVFVHAVGINRRLPIEDYSDRDWDDIVGVNLTSAFHTARAALA